MNTDALKDEFFASDLPVGIYFGLSEEEYLSDPGIGSTDVKNLNNDPLLYWAYSPLNPRNKRGDTLATIESTAYHKRILEGAEAFQSAYCASPEKGIAPEGTLFTADDLKEFLESRGEKKSGSKKELIERVLLVDPQTPIWEPIVAQYLEENKGKIPIKYETFEDIEFAAKFVEADPELQTLLAREGYPEVSIFCVRDGIRYRARIDRLFQREALDLKAFANIRGKRAEVAAHHFVAEYRLHLQAALYSRLIPVAKEMARAHVAGEGEFVFGSVDPEWLKGFAGQSFDRFWLLMQQKGAAPIALARSFHPKSSTMELAGAGVDRAINIWERYFDNFGSAPWVTARGLTHFEDEQFPIWMTE